MSTIFPHGHLTNQPSNAATEPPSQLATEITSHTTSQPPNHPATKLSRHGDGLGGGAKRENFLSHVFETQNAHDYMSVS